ncbi:hypothetical protein [Neobacillus drentensis]
MVNSLSKSGTKDGKGGKNMARNSNYERFFPFEEKCNIMLYNVIISQE